MLAASAFSRYQKFLEKFFAKEFTRRKECDILSLSKAFALRRRLAAEEEIWI